jgi:8-oxo-dGTP pyrophosphatase MutT (NUDIX family)
MSDEFVEAKTERQAIADANDRIREYLNNRLERDATDIARLYKGSRDRLVMHLRGLYDTYLADEPTYVRARITGTLSRFNQAINEEIDTLTDEVGQRAVTRMAELMNEHYSVLDRALGKRLGGLFEKIPISSRSILGELTQSIIGGATFEDRVMHASDMFKRDVFNDLRRGLINGDDFSTIRGKLMKTFGVDKLAKPQYNAYGSVKLYKNEARRQWNLLMKQQGEKTNGKLVWWAMIDDSEITPGCAARHGMEIEDELDGEVPPRHYNCRCTVAVFPADYDLTIERRMAAAVVKKLGYTQRSAMLEESWVREGGPGSGPRPGQKHPHITGRPESKDHFAGTGVSPDDVHGWAASAGGKFNGVQVFPGRHEPLVLVTDDKHGSTGAIPISQVSQATVHAKIADLRSREAGWGWGKDILQPIGLITEIDHLPGIRYRSAPWQSLPREAAGLVVDPSWTNSPRAGVAGDRPDQVLLRLRGRITEVKTWTGWRPLAKFTTAIETRTGLVDDSAVIQPAWDEITQYMPRQIVERWPALAHVTFPVNMGYAIALVDDNTAEGLTTGAIDVRAPGILWLQGLNLQQDLMTLFWRQGHPHEPYFVYATLVDSIPSLRTIVNITTGDVLYASNDFASPLLAPYTRVAAAVLEDGGRIWAVIPRGRAQWVLPGGHIDDGETPRDAVVREMLEETGQHVRVIRNLGVLYRPWSRTIIFLCHNIVAHHEWVPTDETDGVMAISFTDLALDERLFLERHGVTALWEGVTT